MVDRSQSFNFTAAICVVFIILLMLLVSCVRLCVGHYVFLLLLLLLLQLLFLSPRLQMLFCCVLCLFVTVSYDYFKVALSTSMFNMFCVI